MHRTNLKMVTYSYFFSDTLRVFSAAVAACVTNPGLLHQLKGAAGGLYMIGVGLGLLESLPDRSIVFSQLFDIRNYA